MSFEEEEYYTDKEMMKKNKVWIYKVDIDATVLFKFVWNN